MPGLKSIFFFFGCCLTSSLALGQQTQVPGPPNQAQSPQAYPSQDQPQQTTPTTPSQPHQAPPAQDQQGYPPPQSTQSVSATAQPAPPPAPQAGDQGQYAQPQPMPVDPQWVRTDARQHEGFFLRLQAGPGYSVVNGESDITISGFGLGIGVSIGGVVAENFVIHGDLYGVSALDPEIEQGNRGGDLDGTISNGSLGIGATYYFMPINFFITAGVGYAAFAFEPDNGDRETIHGFGFRLQAGKEWWVSDDWGLGMAGQFTYSRTSEDDADFDSLTFSVLFSATYN